MKLGRRTSRVLATGGQIAVFAVIAWFIYQSLAKGFESSNFLALHFDWRWLTASWILLAVYYALYTLGLDLVMQSLGSRLTYAKAFKLNFATNPGKYVPPGVIWPAVGRAALAPRMKLSSVHAVVSLVLEAGLSSAAGIIVFILSLGFGAKAPVGTQPWIWAGLAILLICLHPAIFRRALAIVFRVVRVKHEVPSLRYGATLGLVAFYALTWLTAGAAFQCFTLALVKGAQGNILEYAGVYAVATIAGMVIPGGPAGLGEREAVLALLLTPYVGPGVAVVVAFAARVWFTLLELGLSGAALAMPASIGPQTPADGDMSLATTPEVLS